ncbi:substrate-binding periplasmic protein [Chitinimonas sp. BJB300]|uniref:substrate-binding periplasmic protein n=1 Tax=Chitinimonas sp. BJB300 TaxID=1559339 RepID=UPI00117C4506|nr:transporter substrate-binding domain-containing protein [Chitinimonas sp. BJB300]
MDTWLSRLVLCLPLFILQMAHAEIKTAAQTDSEPKYIKEGNAAVGICVDIMRAVEKIDPSLKFVGDQQWQPLARIEANVESGELDAGCGLQKNKAREAKFQFPATALFPVKWMLAVRVDDDIKISSWDDVKKLGPEGVVLVNFGSGALKTLEAVGGLVIDSGGRSNPDNLIKLEAKRGRFYYYRSPGFVGELKAFPGKFKILPTVMDSADFHMMFGKHVPAATVEKFNKALMELEKKGELEKMVKKWDS